MKKSPNKLGAALDLLGVGDVVRQSRKKVARTLAKAGMIGLVAHGAGKYAEKEYRDATGYKPEVMVAQSSGVGEKLAEGAEELKRQTEDRLARKMENWWGKMKRKAKERTEKALEWGQKEVVPVEDIRREYHEARNSVKEIKNSTLETGNETAYWGTFILALMAQLKLASLLAGRRKKKERTETEESIESLKARKEVLEAQTKLAQMEAKAAALQAQLEKARALSPAQLNETTQLEAESAELLDSLAPELENAPETASSSH